MYFHQNYLKLLKFLLQIFDKFDLQKKKKDMQVKIRTLKILFEVAASIALLIKCEFFL